MNPTIRAARPDDLDRIEQLLVASSLTLAGVADTLSGFSVAEENGKLIGVVAIEPCGDYGLLRSAAVDSTARNRGIGSSLVNEAIARAKADHLRSLYLLTTTAESYFPPFGFEPAPRDQVPESVRGTIEFTETCCASAAVMKLDLEK